MFCKTLKLSFLLVFTCCVATWAGDANDCIREGRQYMFDGTLSGLRLAYQTFDNCLNDPCCADCSTNRELIFLRAVTGTAVLVIGDDANSIDSNSVFGLAKQFGMDVLGEYWAPYFDPCGLDLNVPSNQYDAYEIPAGAPDANGIRNIIDTNMIPEIEAIIADLNSINDEPNDRFRIFLDPNETRIFFDPNAPGLQNDVEVDYGEVLILKGLLTALKARLQAQSAYDMYTDTNDMLVEKVYGGSFNINADLLDPHPDLLNVLPTPNYPDANGKAILAQARQDWIDSIDYYLYTIDYIRREREEDPNQEDELFYIDPNDDDTVDVINDRLITLRDSLINDTVATFPWETAKIYTLEDTNSATTWELELVFDFIGLDAEGSFVLVGGSGVPSPWEITYFTIEDDELIAEMDYDVPGYWGGALFTSIISQDHNDITNGTFEYWGLENGTIYNLSGQLVSTEIEDANIDLNPIFGSSPDVNDPRYVQPVNPRDLLPEFDEWNGAQPGTVGHGLGDDATLGGITPDMNQYDWQVEFDLQPGGLFYLDFISPGQIQLDGEVNDWTADQIVFADISGDTEGDSNDVKGVDIKDVYMAYGSDNIYGAISFYDQVTDPNQSRAYNLTLSYSPDNPSTLDSLRFEVNADREYIYGHLYHMTYDEWGWVWWQHIADLDFAIGQNAVEFKVPFADFPSDLPGRFISVKSRGWDPSWYRHDGEENLTHLRIGDVGTISGTITYSGYRGAPIFIQAYTDPEDPENSIVASTMILEPGLYTLDSIGLGWQGYVRAFTPLFGFNIFDLEALTIEASVSVFMFNTEVDGVDIVLNNPPILEKDIWVFGEIDTMLDKEDWYAFDAVQGGTYTLDVNRLTSQYAAMTLYGRDGHTDIEELYYWQAQQINWMCPVSGRYYVKVKDTYWQPEGGTYEIRMTSDLTCPDADIACADWVGVKDCKVDFYDLTVLVSHWLDGCSEPYWCDESDFDESCSIDFADFALLANEWLQDGIP